MAVIDSTTRVSSGSQAPALRALTMAAQLLLGQTISENIVAEETDDTAGLQYSHYQEGKRNLYGEKPDNRNPIEVDSFQGHASVSLTDRIKFGFNYTQDTWSGATPIASAPLIYAGNNPVADSLTSASPYISRPAVYVDSNFRPVKFVGSKILDNDLLLDTDIYSPDERIVHTLSIASPETRKQGDFRLSYDWDEASASIGGGISSERDYESRFGSVGGRLDFNQKLTSLNFGLSYTNSDTNALIDHDAAPYINTGAYAAMGQTKSTTQGTRLVGNKEDVGVNLGLTQVLNKEALVQLDVGFTHSNGYMANPYKVVETLFVNPNQIPDAEVDGNLYFEGGGQEGFYRPGNVLRADVKAFLEKRPSRRNQWNFGGRFVQHIPLLDAAMHLDYHFSHDDWGINSHTFEADWVQPVGSGWTITPRVRYYSQDAAGFYKPYLVINQSAVAGIGNRDYQKLPDNYSSDQRLSAYGALSGGVSITKQFAKGITLETGFEYYTHAGSLKMGGGGEGDYADFSYFVANAGLNVNFSAIGAGKSADDHGHHHHHHHGAPVPAGVMFAHMMDQADAFMVGYRYMYGIQAGNMLHGSRPVGNSELANQACGTAAIDKCYVTPGNMNMHMHMLDLMYAPTDWLNLMLMPQFVDMDMTMRKIADPSDFGIAGTPSKLAHIEHHVNAGHSTGGVGDTGIYALFKLLGTPNHHVNLTLGVTAPTGDVGNRFRRNHQIEGGFADYGMQLGSGTWDFKPAFTYTGQYDDWSWGLQVNGTKRLENHNESGYVLGDILQSTAWGSYQLWDWLSASVRGVYTNQGAIRGQFNGLVQELGPQDYTRNYGGRYWDIGVGLNGRVTGGSLVGHSLGVEWLQPLSTYQLGYQLDRDGALAATWSYAF